MMDKYLLSIPRSHFEGLHTVVVIIAIDVTVYQEESSIQHIWVNSKRPDKKDKQSNGYVILWEYWEILDDFDLNLLNCLLFNILNPLIIVFFL